MEKGVFIPRPETEKLVQRVIDEAKNLKKPKIADVGTGCGAIAIAIASNVKDALIYAIDISDRAIRLARRNIKRLGIRNIKLLKGDLLTPLPTKVNIIVANLPYIRDDELKALPREIREYEPPESYMGGEDGLLFIRRLLEDAGSYLEDGSIFLEVSTSTGEGALQIAEEKFKGRDIKLEDNILIIS